MIRMRNLISRYTLFLISLSIYDVFLPRGSNLFAVAQTTTNTPTRVVPSCQPGKYDNGGTCEDCQPGFSCAGFNAQPQECSENTYQNQQEQTTCIICPAGKSCADPAANPIPCIAGEYSPKGSVNCTACPEGYWSTPESAHCDVCPAGSECDDKSTTACSPGFFSSAGNNTCFPCPKGHHTNGQSGQSKCDQCPGGYQCQDLSIPPEECGEGYYSKLGNGECSSCPAGYFCPSSTTSTFTACPPGTYSTGGSGASCENCPAGKSCLNTTETPLDCESGTYSPEGGDICIPCPAGSRCVNPVSNPTSCYSGEFSLAGNGTCYPCYVGYFCPETFLAPVSCPPGTTTNKLSNQTKCDPCPDGLACTGANSAPVTCGVGDYLPAGAQECQPCPDGTSCSGSTATPCDPGTYALSGDGFCTGCNPGTVCPYTTQNIIITCSPGTYSLENQTYCTPCPAGKECPDTKSATENDCGDGFYSFGSQQNCTACPAGQMCPKKNGNENVYCLPGFYSTGQSKSCKECAPGFACPFTDKNTTLTCKKGTFSGSGQTVCTKCPVGYQCPEQDTVDGGATPCDPGSYSGGGQVACTDCLPGFACPSSFSAYNITCSEGTFSEAKQTACTPCPAGMFCPDTDQPGKNCQPGFYSLGMQISCTECPAGYQCLNNRIYPTKCPAGTYATSNSTKCDLCDAGYVCEEGSTRKDPGDGICPLGYFCDSGTVTPQPCGAGYYGAKEGLAGEGECTDCPVGYFCPGGTVGIPSVANTDGMPSTENICPKGHYCLLKTESANQHPCPSGTYNPSVGAIEEADCEKCLAGRYCPPGFSEPGLPCPKGHYCGTGTGEFPNPPPTPCDAGTYTAEEGASTDSACLGCPAGYYCTKGTSNPEPCPPGTFQPSVDQSSNSSCQDCTQGMICSTTALVAPDGPCSPGHFCPKGTSFGTQYPCQAGTYTDANNLTAAIQCETCPARYACYNGTGGQNLAPANCAPGYYCAEGTEYPTQTPCLPGTYSNKTNLGSPEECWECPRGYYCAENSTTPQGPCPMGYYCPNGTEYATQHECPAGSFSNKTGNVRIEDCDQCIGGSYCTNASTTPSPCPPGTFNQVLGSSGSEACTSCLAGYYCPDNATTEPVPCGIGMYSNTNQAACDKCPAGYYCDEDTVTYADLINKTCPAGTFCDNGTSTPPNLLDDACPSGFYCLNGGIAPFPLPCPAGTYSIEAGLKEIVDCLDCTAGSYCDVTNLTQPAGSCPPGYYCPTGTKDAKSFPCDPGTFLYGTAAISVESCTNCTSGFYCDEKGMSEPKPCLTGSFCEPGSVTPQPCIEGTYNNRTLATSELECTPCPGGFYCEGTGNTEPTNPCNAGFYCIESNFRPDPPSNTSRSYGGVCPKGGYCPEGSAYPTACEPGFFVNGTGSKSKDSCKECEPGKYCSGLSTKGYTGLCYAGYYCTGGASQPTQHSTEPGYHSSEGAKIQEECLPGSYSPGYHYEECLPCDAGRYCPTSGLSETLNCTEGHYCPTGSNQTKACPVGTYNNLPGQMNASSCNPCEEGFYCDEEGLPKPINLCKPGFWCGSGSTTGTPDVTDGNGGPCMPGYYCPEGTKSAYDYPCWIGTFNNKSKATNESFCDPCLPGRSCSIPGLSEPNGYCSAGYYCPSSAENEVPTDDVVWGFPCSVGYYCPEGSGAQEPCPPGNYTADTHQAACKTCPTGSECSGYSNVEDCREGHYCPAGTGDDPPKCPVGTYMDARGAAEPSDCKPCASGFYCNRSGLTEAKSPCDARFYCKSGVNVSNPSDFDYSGDGGRCPAGYFCPEGTGEPQPCPVRKYSDEEGNMNEADCKFCDAGKVCSEPGLTAPNENCSAGYFCAGGANVTTPTDNKTEGGDFCPVGFYCPEGTENVLTCPPGSFSNETGLAQCTLCVEGFYCPGGTVDYTSYQCEPGYYCPTGTDDYKNFPCPPGTYGTKPQLPSSSSCLPCDPGKYCIDDGKTTVSGDCDPGFYCLSNSSSPSPMGLTNYTGPDTCSCPASDVGGVCPVGYYCPGGTGLPVPCKGGHFCNDTGLSETAGTCYEGYYCSSGATRPDPTDGITGGICPKGYWCGEGSDYPEPCPSGTFNNKTQRQTKDDCFLCTAGFYCPDPGQTEPVDPCEPGFYCPAGESVGNAHPCEPGYKCPIQSGAQILCESGSYQNEPQAVTCKECPAGFYCDNTIAPISDYSRYPCPNGSFCPNGTESKIQYLCPSGTYGTREQLQNASGCDACPTGKFCPTEGLTETDVSNPTYNCDTGYFCMSGVNSSAPDDYTTGRPCSKGHYCPEGTTEERNCKVGKFNNVTGRGFEANCQECTGGFYCDQPGLEIPIKPCSAGYFCSGGDQTPASLDKNCTVGHFCPEQTELPFACPYGKYTADRFSTECSNCTAGRYCVDGIHQEECPLGFYCPSGTGINWRSCPIGTYGQAPGLQSESDCQLCDPGQFCNRLNATKTSGPCQKKYYCRNGSTSDTPNGSDGINGQCSPGHYCPAGTPIEEKCPPGTYSDQFGLASQKECSPCPAGSYCEGGLSTTSGNCSGGYYCLGNATSAQIPDADSTGGLCPTGFYCPSGTSYPKSCPPGRYNNLPRQEECFECVAGYYCPENASTYLPYECPVGHYCPNGTKEPEEFPCPAGTFNNGTGKQDLRGCTPCSPGYYCDTKGLPEPRGKCKEGWYCSLCSWSRTPGTPSYLPTGETSCLCPVEADRNSTGGSCQLGYFCPEGIDSPQPCTPGYFCDAVELGNVSGECDAGFYCSGGASSRTPRDGVTGDQCPKGHYCEKGSSDKTACPPGTFSDQVKNTNLGNCSDCTAGFYCSGGEGVESGPCRQGYYCPVGQSVDAPADFECPPGFKCPPGAGLPTPCDSGTYQALAGQASCDECPEGYYCESSNIGGLITGTSVPQECKEGYFCPNGTKSSTEFGCPEGTYGNRTLLTNSSLCEQCDGGKFCKGVGLREPSGPCMAGFFCALGAIRGDPNDGITGNICPYGYYCPNGTQEPIGCANGTFGEARGLTSQDNCTNCTGGMYCPTIGQNMEEGDCKAGYFCPDGSDSAVELPCPAGYQCPLGSSAPQPCLPGSYTNVSLQSSCVPCDQGSYCDGTSIQDCPAGFYCPLETGKSLEACPPGTYSNTTGLYSVEQCKFCDAGFYCPDWNATSYAGECAAGFYCRNGSDTREPSGSHIGDAGVCPPGHYCPKGTGEPFSCQPGTFNRYSYANGSDWCDICTAGFYCNESGLDMPTDPCFEGYYCTGGATEPEPSVATPTGGPCPQGSYCPMQSEAPKECDGGSYAPDQGMSTCLGCPAGSFCPPEANRTIQCLLGHYCEKNSTAAQPCTNGTYNNETGSQSADACQYCSPGYYCPEKGMDGPKGKCAPGWYCVRGSWMRKPNAVGLSVTGSCACPDDGAIGGQCQPGEYCPEGASIPIPCDAGYYCDEPELHDVKGPCISGHYCSGGSKEKAPVGQTYGDVCPTGHYCPENSSSPTPCPIGTFSNTQNNTNDAACMPCDVGWYCPKAGLSLPEDECDSGYFCPKGSSEKAPPDNLCPSGTQCPRGSAEPTPCFSGTYQPDNGQESCLVCQEGTYCDYDEAIAIGLEGVMTANICPLGFYCPKGTNFSTQYPCPEGTYGHDVGLPSKVDCKQCDEGYYCDQLNATSPTDECYAGYYCPAGSSSPKEENCTLGSYCTFGSSQPTECPSGTYGSALNLEARQQCTDCDPGSYCATAGLTKPTDVCSKGYYCTGNSTEADPIGQSYGDECPPGSYCPMNSSKPTPCPSGFYNPDSNGRSLDDCSPCTPGFYCFGSGRTNVSGSCLEGYYCNGSASSETEANCIVGHYCPANSAEPTPCLSGTYQNTTNSHTCKNCPVGWYCVDGAVKPLPCPPGYYCPDQTGLDWKPCPSGTYNPNEEIGSENDCTLCRAGHYCETPGSDSVTGPCSPGFNCLLGVDTSQPDNITNKGSGEPCQVGFQCPSGYAESCPPGTYADLEGFAYCQDCQPGYYCTGGTIIPSECQKGYYCLSRTEGSDQYPCPTGTFNNETGQQSETSCIACTGGWYCDGFANPEPDELCEEGYYCVSGSDTPTPQVTGNIEDGSLGNCSNIFDCVCPALNDTKGGICPPGYYCPRGSTEPTLCDDGKYCPDYGMKTPAGNCSAGHYCVNGSLKADQYSCEPGYFCESGTGVPHPCPQGTFSKTSLNTNEMQCQNCTEGMYCEGTGNPKPTGKCAEGFYCTGGDWNKNPNICSENHYCPEGAVNETVCKAGQYQPQEGQGSCIDCKEGSICDPTDGNLNPENCPQGYFCPTGTPDIQACPLGTYGTRDNLVSEEECTQCDGGKFCRESGAKSPTGDCYAGYYCTGGAKEPNPIMDRVNLTADTFTGNSFCPPGYYCENGTDIPTACPAGTFINKPNSTSLFDCLPCPAGKYCDTVGMVDGYSAPDCDARYYCTEGALSPRPPNDDTGGLCPKGYFCPTGTAIPFGCDPGTYSPNEGAEICDVCEPGTYCPNSNTSKALSCIPGFYCPSNTSDPLPCLEGTYNSIDGASNDTQCLLCPPGQYCNGTGNVGGVGPCMAGYLCKGGSVTPTPSGLTSTAFPYNGPCPVGKYCLEGDMDARDCPRGTIRETVRAASEDDCLPCPEGFYCENPGLSSPTAKCSCGYFCDGLQPNSNPNQMQCPTGNYCPVGSSAPEPCKIGSYQPNAGECTCIPCRPGFFCNDTLSGGQTPCPPYSYCSEGTPSPVPCPNGTFTEDDDFGLESEFECKDCPSGRFCYNGRKQGNCSGGILCVARAVDPISNGSVENCEPYETCAGSCPAGYYCPEGTIVKEPCPENTLQNSTGASSLSYCMNCPAGQWCHEGDPISEPCPVGFYCLGLNTSDCNMKAGPQPCPRNKYRNETGGKVEEDCFDCPAGFWCNETGISNYSSSACALGYYCTGGGEPPRECPGGTLRDTPGAKSMSDCRNCTPGYYCPSGTANIDGIPCAPGEFCPEGSAEPDPCPAGYYCTGRTSDPKICPEGYFCPEGSSNATLCDYPYYCPEGSPAPKPCDSGSQPLNISGLRTDLAEACMACLDGFYRNSSTDEKCLPCPPGYYCPEGTGDYTENPCPIAHYCPEGGITNEGGRTGYPIPCPAGTYGQQAGSEFSICQNCPAGMYNNKEGQAACFPCGSSATSAEGATVCTCQGFNRAFQASDGSCVCKSGYVYYDDNTMAQSQDNSPNSCEEIVDDRCSEGQTRAASDRSCVISSLYSCQSVCPLSNGTLDVDLGMCLCDSVTVPEEIPCYDCNTMAATLDPTTGVLTITTTTTASGNTTSVNVPNVYGPSDVVNGPANTILIQMSPQGVSAVLPTTPDIVSSFVGGTVQQNTSDPTTQSRKRRSIENKDDEPTTGYFGRKILQASPPTAAPVTTDSSSSISNPVICLQIGEMLIFSINLNERDRSLSNYPQYVRDHLYNSNPSFDYGAFRQLELYILQSNWTVNNFAQVFLEPGIYVFRDSQEPGQEIIVNVYANGLVCDSSRIQPTTRSSISSLGVAKQPVDNLTTNWVVIGVIFGIFGACVLILVIAVIVWRPRDDGVFPMKNWMPRFRALGQLFIPPYKGPDHYTSLDARVGLGMIRERGEGEGADADVLKDEQLLEDFNVRTLYNKLEDQNLHLSSHLKKQQKSSQKFYDKINKQAEALSKMLNNLDVSKLQAAAFARSSASAAAASQATASIKINSLDKEAVHDGGQSGHEKEILRSLEALINKLNSGKITVSDEVLNDARNRLRGMEKTEVAQKSKSANTKDLQRSDEWRLQGHNQLTRTQQSDRINLDRELLAGEEEALSKLLITHDNQRKKLISDINNELAFKMQGELSEKEINSLLSEHEQELENALNAFSNERNRQMKELQEQLAAKRRLRSKQLKKFHDDKCKEAGITAPRDIDDDADQHRLSLLEKQLEEAILQESSLSSKEEQVLLSEAQKELQINLSKTLADELDTMTQNGLISEEVRDKLRRQIIEQEEDLNRKMERKRETQIKAMRDRMAKRKRNKIKKLQDQHEEEKVTAKDEFTPEMEEIQKSEMEAMEAELDAEVSALERDMEDALQVEHEEVLKELHREVINDMSEKHGIDSVAQQELLDRFRSEIDNFDQAHKLKRSQQSKELQAKLAARRARRAAEIQKEMEEERMAKLRAEDEEKRLEELARIQEEQEKQSKEETDGFAVRDVQQDDVYLMEKLSRKQEWRSAEAELHHAAETEKLALDLNKIDADDAESLEKKLREEKERLMREATAKHATQIEARSDLSDEQVEMLLSAHQQELDELERSLEDQQKRQRAALEEKIAARRRRKTDALKRRQELEKEEEKINQRKDLTELQAQAEKDAERKVIVDGIERNGALASERIIQDVLEKRQLKEMKDLEEEFLLKKKLLLEQALELIREQYHSAHDALLVKYASDLLQLENEKLPAEECTRRKEKLIDEQSGQLSKLEIKHEQECKEIEETTVDQWNLEFAQAKLNLKEQHYQEFAAALKQLAPSASQEQSAETARRLEETKKRLQTELKETKKRLADERNQLEEEEKRRVAMALEEFEKELAVEIEQDELKVEKTLKTLADRKEKLLQEKKKKIKEEIERAAAAGASEEEQKKILEQYEKDVEKLMSRMDHEKLRMRNQLEERLKKKKKEKLQSKKQELREENKAQRKEIDELQNAEMKKVQQQQLKELQLVTENLEKEKSFRKVSQRDEFETEVKELEIQQKATSVQPSDAPDAFTPVPVDSGLIGMPYAAVAPVLGEDEVHLMLSSSPLYQILREIEEVLSEEVKKPDRSETSHPAFVGPDVNSSDRDLIPTPLSTLSAKEMIAYKFGTFILGLLRMRRSSHPPINLLVAEKVPAHPELKGNVFRGSFSFDEGNAILYIKRERLVQDSVGQLSLLLVHAMAHIATGSFADDSSIKFMEEFYRCLAVLSDDLFFARYKSEPQKTDKNAVEKMDFTQDVLDVKFPARDVSTFSIKTPGQQGHFNEQIQKYTHAGVSPVVKDELKKMEETFSQNKSSRGSNEIDLKLSKLVPSSTSAARSASYKHSEKMLSTPANNEQDMLNEEFVELTKESTDLQSILMETSASDSVGLRNRLKNVKIRLTDVENRLRSIG